MVSTATPQDLGQSHRAALRSGQGARRLGAQVGGPPAQHVAIRATVPLALAADASIVRRDRVPGRGDPLGRALVPAVSDQLPRPRTDADRQGRRGGSHDHVPPGPALRPGAGETDAPACRFLRYGEGALRRTGLEAWFGWPGWKPTQAG